MISKKNFKAFTVVELVIVITILVILWTIWFMSYSSHLVWSRDANRLSQLITMNWWLEVYSTDNILPQPDNIIEIRANWSVIWYQWYIWKSILWMIGYSQWWMDPKDEQYFSYYLTKDKKNFQLMSYLEDIKNIQSAINIFNHANAIDYSKRYPTVYWKKLGILTESGTNIPIQEIPAIVSYWYIDIATTPDNYKAYFTDNESIYWTWEVLNVLENISLAWNILKNCKDYLAINNKLSWKNWIYYILKSVSIIQTYCDMTTDWWWWTMFSSNWWHLAWTPTSWNSFYWKLSKTTMWNMVINNLEYSWIMAYHFNENNYIIFDNINSSLVNAELKDTAWETSSNATAQTNIWLTKHKGYINNYSFSKNTTNSVFEVHRIGWLASNWTNWIFDSWPRTPWFWPFNSLSFWLNWSLFKDQNSADIYASGWYWLFFR